jgi:deoxycytidylate deaminase
VKRHGRYKDGDSFEVPSISEYGILENLCRSASDHNSGGSYDMLAMWVKGSKWIQGRNRLDRPAYTIDPSYPEVCGVHAELDLWHKADSLNGGTVYIAGRRNNSGTIMTNTRPCIYCSAILIETGVRYAVFYVDGEPRKMRVSNLLKGINV